MPGGAGFLPSTVRIVWILYIFVRGAKFQWVKWSAFSTVLWGCFLQRPQTRTRTVQICSKDTNKKTSQAPQSFNNFKKFPSAFLHPENPLSYPHLRGASDQPVVKLLQDAALRTNSSSLALLSRRIRSVLRLGSQGIFVGSVVKWKGFGVLEVVVYF